MNQETVPGVRVTLDTNVLRRFWEDHEKKAVVQRLLALAKEKDIDLAITARVREDIPEEPLASKVNTLAEIGVRETGSVTRLGYWKLGRDQTGFDKFVAFQRELESARKERDPKLPDWRDWDHLHAHLLQGRTVFLTWDDEILRLSDALRDRFGIRVETPEDLLAEISTDPSQDAS
jgi:hypothetical protein